MLALPSLKTRLLLLGDVSPAINSAELVVLLHGLRRFNARIGRGLPALNAVRFMPSRGATAASQSAALRQTASWVACRNSACLLARRGLSAVLRPSAN